MNHDANTVLSVAGLLTPVQLAFMWQRPTWRWPLFFVEAVNQFDAPTVAEAVIRTILQSESSSGILDPDRLSPPQLAPFLNSDFNEIHCLSFLFCFFLRSYTLDLDVACATR